MSYDKAVAERIRDRLAERSGVAEKRMVGGLSFNVNGSMCVGVVGAELMVRVGRAARDEWLARPHVRPMKFAGRPLAGFVCVDPDGFRTDEELDRWIQRGIDFVSTLPARTGADRELS